MHRNEQDPAAAGSPCGLDALLARHALTLGAARAVSLQLCAALGQTLAAALDARAGIEAVVAAGSLGRLEAHAGSDFDGILLATRDGPDRVPDAFFDVVERCGLKPPKADGIYRRTVHTPVLCQPALRGSLEEPAEYFGKRMQLLLDARAVLGETAFAGAQRDVLAWYAGDTLARYPDAQWTLLINDLMRYLHAYAGWQQFKFSHGADDGWYLRQAKLRSSRVLTFAGLLLLLGASSTLGTGKFEWLAARLPLSPLARVALVMLPIDAAAFTRLLVDYEAVHALLATPAVRAQLVALGPPGGEAPTTAYPPLFATIHAHTGRMLRELSQFVLARRTDCHPDFFSYLLF